MGYRILWFPWGGLRGPPSEIKEGVMFNRMLPELKKVGSTGSTLPAHSRFSPGTHKTGNYPKDVMIAFKAICSVKRAQFIYISLLLVCSIVLGCPIIQNTEFVLRYNWWNINRLYNKLRNREITNFCSRNTSALFSALVVDGWVVVVACVVQTNFSNRLCLSQAQSRSIQFLF